MINRPLRAALLGCASLIASATISHRAHAQWIVHDPSNMGQNVLQAARALQQVNNQIQSLQNEAQMLINQARNLASLPYSSLQQLQQSVARTQQLLQQAQRIAYSVTDIERAFQSSYGASSGTGNDQQLLDGARERWRNAVAGFEDAMRVQATVVGNLGTTRTEMDGLVASSQGATGALQATQAGNQLLALQSQQLADLTAVVAAQGRAQALEQARLASGEEQAREQLERFLAPGSGYQPGSARMFYRN